MTARDLAGVKALVFDVFGTVVDWRGGVVRDLAALGRSRGLIADWGQFADDWRASYPPAMDRVRKGELPWTPVDALHRMILDGLVAKYGLKGLSDAETDHLNRAWHRLDPWPDAVAGLTRLKRHFVIGTLSNGNVSLLVDLAKHGHLPWDVVFSAELVRHYKPDREAYLLPAALLGLDPAAVMLVAAHPGDLEGASRAGLRTAFVARPLEFGAKGKPHQVAAGQFDLNAQDFNDLAHQLLGG
ncbi:MAG TPA: haloacid dehalogenase type II [Stellaceae bacterium]|nr:haloacid dehalogenase type II [Stellaceae bacterium]